ncbi:NAD(P)-binding protein [Microthyrium microscopicum]|uniref:NAD(P)-binding protein n=1 Tax=Microthyrium microscopicum TaxID=703497 RepID=A0A6A6U133_9PEZI|nr:NAD(P)-binding protein [Microthyrium microscopicum]
MARFFITGSSDGLGSMAAQALIKKGHEVVLHARNAQRAKDASAACPGAEGVLVADLSSLTETKKLAEEVNNIGPFDCIIHNAGLYRGGIRRNDQNIPALTAVNTLAPYILTALIEKPKRLVYVSSGMHYSGVDDLSDLDWQKRNDRDWSDGSAYSNSKFHNVLVAKAVAKRWPDVQSNALDPGWIPTKMGGSSAPGNSETSMKTYLLLSTETKETGKYFASSKLKDPKEGTDNEASQNKYMELCEKITGVPFPQ